MTIETEVALLVRGCTTGGSQQCAQLLSLLDDTQPGDPLQDLILDQLASVGPASATAVDALVAALYQQRFVRAEIRKILINDSESAEEALQETALAMVGALPSFRGDSSFRTWVTRIARNKAIEALRRKRPSVSLDDFHSSAGGSAPELTRYSSMLADRLDVTAAIAALPPEFRDAVRLRDIDQKSYEEIAEILDIKLNTVRSRLARGRARLAATFDTA